MNQIETQLQLYLDPLDGLKSYVHKPTDHKPQQVPQYLNIESPLHSNEVARFTERSNIIQQLGSLVFMSLIAR